MELTTVADDHAVVHDGLAVRRYDDLEPDTLYEFDGFAFRTLVRPAGALLATFATVNDVHFGEVECGVIDGHDMVPTYRVADYEEPYPETMNRGAIHEIEQLRPDVVVVKGDLTSEGTDEQYRDFLEFYGEAFGDQLVVTRGNHDAHAGATFESEPFQRVDLPGVVLAVLDTAVTGRASGTVTGEQLEWLHDLAADVGLETQVYVFGHHHVWSPDTGPRPDDYFGVDPDASVRLIEVVAARPNIRGYFAGHTHRNRVHHISISRDVPWVEVACVKDFPGAWAEYRVFEGGLVQVFRRISTPDALVWSERTRDMYHGLYEEYAFGELGDRCFTVPAHRPA